MGRSRFIATFLELRGIAPFMLVRHQIKRIDEAKANLRKSGTTSVVESDFARRATVGAKLQRTIGNQSLQRRPKKSIPKEAITSDKLPKGKLEEKDAFRRQVYDAQLAHSVATKEFFAGLPEDQIGEVEDNFKLRKDAAKACKDLLNQARSDLASQQKDKDAQALRVRNVGLASAYRDLPHDFRAWQDAFATAYKQTADKRQALTGGEHGEAAVKLMVKDMRNRKAIPGFSNHSQGIAVDFATTEGKNTLGPRKAQADAWRKSWFYNWLLTHAATYQFKQLPSEEWHWDFQGEDKNSKSPTGYISLDPKVLWV